MKKIIFSSIFLASTALFSIAQAEISIVNGSFEEEYEGWTLVDQELPTYGTWGIAENETEITTLTDTYDYAHEITLRQQSVGLPHTYMSAEGTNVAYHLQTAPGLYKMYQDIYVCPQAGSLLWKMEYNNHANPDEYDPIFDDEKHYSAVEIFARDQGGQIITTPVVSSKTSPGDDASIGMTEMSIDVSEVREQNVRLMVTHQVGFGYFDAAWDDFRIEGCESNALSLNTEGFDSPAIGAILVKKNNTLPLKATIYNDGVPVTADDIVAPVVQVILTRNDSAVEDVSDQALASGQGQQGTDGNQFVYTDDEKWQFNLKIKNYTAPGAYTATMESGDIDEYTLTPTPTVTFVVE